MPKHRPGKHSGRIRYSGGLGCGPFIVAVLFFSVAALWWWASNGMKWLP